VTPARRFSEGLPAYTGLTMATTTDGVTGSDSVADPAGAGYPPPPRGRFRRGPAHAAWKPPLGRVRRTIREVGFDFITAGIIVLLFVAYQLWGTGFAEASSQNKLKHQFKEPSAAAAPAPATTGAPAEDSPALGAPVTGLPGPPEGTAIAHLKIPKIGVDKYVVEGVTESALREGPGHYPGTPLPGEPGNASIAGHRTTYGAPFYSVNELQKGDSIFVTTDKGAFHYTVDQIEIVKPTDVGVIGPTADNRLTLTTCNPRFSATSRLIVVAMLTDLPATPTPTIAPTADNRLTLTTCNPRFSATSRLIVVAMLTDLPATPTPTIAPTPVAIAAVNLGTGDHGAWPDTLLYGSIFLVLWVGVRLWAGRRRYWKWIPFILGVPICLVPLWFLFENAIRLLPNNI
jgi:sortase A